MTAESAEEEDQRPPAGRRASDRVMDAAAIRLSALTKRERDVLRELAAGKQSKEIARSLNLSPRTVEAHRAKIMRRLRVSNFADLIVLAVQAGVRAI